jgi:tetratricopeptide (TPR) repeat protein
MLADRRHLWIILPLLAGSPMLSARGVTLDQANGHYSAGNFARSAEACEELIEASGPSAARLYNLGNARFRLGEFGPAILAYERAALLAPRDPDIRANLKLAREKAAAHEELPSRAWWEEVLHACSRHEWSWITMGGAMLTGLACLAGGIIGFRRLAMKRGVIAGLVLGVGAAALGGVALRHRRSEKELGIITAAKPVLRLSPFAEANPAGSPATGRTVVLGDRSNGWVYVTVPGAGLSGWIPDSEAPPLVPDPDE